MDLKSVHKLAVAVCSVVTVVLMAGCEITHRYQFSEVAGSTLTTNSTPTNPEYGRFRVGDEVTVAFPDLSHGIAPHVQRIRDDGSIILPLIGPVPAAGKTAQEIQAEIQKLCVAKHVPFIPTHRDHVYTVTGEVNAPGPKLWLPGTTLFDAIESAGGFVMNAKRAKVQVMRANGTNMVINYIVREAIPDAEIPIWPGDKIHVRRVRLF